MATVLLTAEAQQDMLELPRTIHFRVVGILDRLEAWPEVSGAKPLRRGLAGRWRIRTGDWRVQFCVEADRVIVERIRHRREMYEE